MASNAITLDQLLTRQQAQNLTDVMEKNVKLEKAVISLKEVIQESSLKIIDLEANYQSCSEKNSENYKLIKKLKEESVENQMYKRFFSNVINQLRNFNLTDLDFEIEMENVKRQ